MADEDMLTALQRMLSTAGGMVPRAPQPYPGMRPAAGAMPGGNAFGGLPQLAQAGPPGMAAPGGTQQALEQLQQAMGRGAEPSAALPTDLPLTPGMPMDMSGGDRVFRPGGTIGTQLGQNALGIYGRSVPMGNQDTVVSQPQGTAMQVRQAVIDLQRMLAANPQLASALNQMMPR